MSDKEIKDEEKIELPPAGDQLDLPPEEASAEFDLPPTEATPESFNSHVTSAGNAFSKVTSTMGLSKINIELPPENPEENLLEESPFKTSLNNQELRLTGSLKLPEE